MHWAIIAAALPVLLPDERFLMFCVVNHKGGEIDYKGCPEQGSPNCRRVHSGFMLRGWFV
jgi:hypothetical protein